MSESLSSSVVQSLDSIPQNVLVIDRYGTILFVNSSWHECSNEYGLSPRLEWVGCNYFDLLPEWVKEPDNLCNSLKSVLYGEHLVFSAEFPIRCAYKESRVFRFDAFPLITDPSPERRNIVISHHDVGPVIEGRHIQPLRINSFSRKQSTKFIPICASCKSIRNDQEEWLTIERFLQQQLAVQFTHDICPDCIRQLYPKYAGALKGTAGN